MKLNYLIIAVMSLALCDCKGELEPAFKTDVKVTIRDENGQPVEGAEVKLLFSHFDEKKDIECIQNTDEEGRVRASEKVVSSLLLNAGKTGFYPLRYERVLIRMDVDWQKIKNIELPLVMRRIKQPVPLYAKKFAAAVPVFDKPVGIDFQAGDWVKPFGRGEVIDMKIIFKKKLVGYLAEGDHLEEMKEFTKKATAVRKEVWTEESFEYDMGKWNGTLNIIFPADSKEGMMLVDQDYCHYSRLTMPHHACQSGYTNAWKWEEDNYSPPSFKANIGYFLRTRVKLDKQKNIVSANYTKLTSDIQIDPRGKLEFTYVFNPTPNDQNLEFDTNRNLFDELNWDERVVSP